MKNAFALFAAALLLAGAGCGASAPDSKQPPANEVTAPTTPPPQPVTNEANPATTTAPTTKPSESSTSAPTTQPTTGTTSATKAYTMAEVAIHKDASSCWTVINGSVYDLTTWVAQHPGGTSGILSICGKDGTAAFNGQHGGAAAQEKKLATFKIGVLKK